ARRGAGRGGAGTPARERHRPGRLPPRRGDGPGGPGPAHHRRRRPLHPRLRRRRLDPLAHWRAAGRPRPPGRRGQDSISVLTPAPRAQVLHATAGCTTTREKPEPFHGGAALLDRGARLRMLFAGTKAAETLTGLVTNDVIALKPGSGQYAAALTAKGKVIADL